MRWPGYAALALLLAGAGLIVDAVLRGGALVSLVVIVPVVTGSSGEFLLGVLLLIVGLLLLPFGLMLSNEGTPRSEDLPSAAETGAGGVVLIGPVPVFFGSWRGVSRRTRWIVAAVGGTAVILLVVAWVLAVR
jgi:uncharacterized protein (TIGR00304 family)